MYGTQNDVLLHKTAQEYILLHAVDFINWYVIIIDPSRFVQNIVGLLRIIISSVKVLWECAIATKEQEEKKIRDERKNIKLGGTIKYQ